MFSEEELVRRIRAVDARLRPIAEGPVDTTDPEWLEELRRSSPLDEAGVRSEAQTILRALIDEYAAESDDARAAIRSLLRTYTSFAWAAALDVPKTTADGFRAHLLHFSIIDQGRDRRDAKLWLDDLVRTARRAGVDVCPALTEVAALSSREDRYEWGSTAAWLSRRARWQFLHRWVGWCRRSASED